MDRKPGRFRPAGALSLLMCIQRGNGPSNTYPNCQVGRWLHCVDRGLRNSRELLQDQDPGKNGSDIDWVIFLCLHVYQEICAKCYQVHLHCPQRAGKVTHSGCQPASHSSYWRVDTMGSSESWGSLLPPLWKGCHCQAPGLPALEAVP